MSGYTEDHLIEQPAIQLMQHELGWDSVNAYDEWSSGVSNLGREAKREVVLMGNRPGTALGLPRAVLGASRGSWPGRGAAVPEGGPGEQLIVSWPERMFPWARF